MVCRFDPDAGAGSIMSRRPELVRRPFVYMSEIHAIGSMGASS